MSAQAYTHADAARDRHLIGFNPAALGYWNSVRKFWRVELAASPDTAPLYLALDGDRIRWVSEARKAKTFFSEYLAGRFVEENVDVAVRVSA